MIVLQQFTTRVIQVVVLAAAVAVPASNGRCQDGEYPVRAPDALPGTTAGMLSPDFWIDRIEDPDRLLMTGEDITAFNEKNAARTIPADHPYARSIARTERDGSTFNRMDPLGLERYFPGETVRGRLQMNIDRLEKGTFYDRWALPLTEDKKAEWIDAVNLDAVPAYIEPGMAMIVRHTTARLYPTAEPAYRMRGYLDDNSITSLDIGMPVAVLHASKTGDYLFVMSPIAWGWVPARDIAYGNAGEIGRYARRRRFVVAVDHRVPCYSDRWCAVYQGSLSMGERVALKEKTERGFLVEVPVRRHDGWLAFEDGWIRSDAAVHEGWLPYTQRNVIATAFRLLGRPYGWHDSWNERDCGGIMRVIFNCFGFTLPRYWSYEQLCTDHATHVGEIRDVAEKNRMLSGMPAGITFTGTTGHIGLYLGSVDGKPYAIHQCGWNYERDGKEYKMARVVVSDYENIGFNMDRIAFFSPILP